MNRPDSNRPPRRTLLRSLAVTALIPVFLILAVQWDFSRTGRLYREDARSRAPVSLRKFPYPYRAALSVCSDIDNTETPEEFLAIQEFLNTDHETAFGRGVGLEIGNSFYLFDRPGRNEFSWFSDRPEDRRIIRDFIRAGIIDCLHSYGEGCTTRVQAVDALRALERDGCRVPVWINHSDARSNLSKWFPTNRGDRIGDAAYHADLTIPYSVRYISCGSSTSIIGQDAPVSWRSYLSPGRNRCPKSLRNAGKSFLKRVLSRFGLCGTRYFLHRDNALIGVRRLEDGRRVYEFMRFDVHPDGIGYGANSRGLSDNISEAVLRRLVEVGGTGIVYTHLGKNGEGAPWVAPETAVALRNLSAHSKEGRILVTTTSKLLNYVTVRNAIRWSFDEDSAGIAIRIHGIRDPLLGEMEADSVSLQGITFHVPDGKPVRVLVKGEAVRNLRMNPADESGRRSVSFPWNRLKAPEVHVTGR
ncbi:MAG: hypothetical protein QUS35_09660 [bacterium]|nr:hypothetical protein [bacterium]